MIVFDRLVVAGDLRFDRLVDVVSAPFILSITGAQDGAPLTITGTGFDASANTVYAGIVDDDENTPVEIAVDTEGTTEIVTDDIDASLFWLTRATSFFVRNSSGVSSNAVSVTIAPAATERVFAVTQEFLGDSSSRIESDPPLSLGDEIRIRAVSGAALSDPNFTGQGAFDIDDGVTAFDAAVFDGEALGVWATQTIQNLVTTAVVPDVEGDTLAAATASIEAVSLVASVVASVPHATVASGSVITQFPPPTTALPIDGTVELTLSLGDTVALIPNLIGLPQAQAESDRTAAGLTGTVYRIIDGNNTGTVINQSITPGTLVAAGSALDLAISSNLMPDLVGELIQTAEAVIAAAGLEFQADPAEQPSTTYARGEVMSQSPAADSVVAPSDPVTLIVSSGVLADSIAMTEDGYVFSTTPDVPMTLYAVALRRGSAEPSAAQIVAGTDGADAAALAQVSVSASPGISVEVTLSGLTYPKSDLYLVGLDEFDTFTDVEAYLDQLKSAPAGRQYIEVDLS